MLDILDLTHQLKITNNIVYQQMLLVEIIDFNYKTIAKLLKRN